MLTLSEISVNIEGLLSQKQTLLSELCNKTVCDGLFVHDRGEQSRRPKLNGKKLILLPI